MDESKWGADPLEGLTDIQRFGLEAVLSDVNAAEGWSWQRPVLLRNRCWMQLNQIQLDQLHRFLPPDVHAEAPELVHYQTLVREGIDPLVAQQSCWDEFGIDDCQRALQTFWISQERPNHCWTAQRYRSLVSLYRDCIERGINTIPMLVLARQGSSEPHQLHWLTASPPVMRHTCA
jgi:hypothetical protein